MFGLRIAYDYIYTIFFLQVLRKINEHFQGHLRYKTFTRPITVQNLYFMNFTLLLVCYSTSNIIKSEFLTIICF